MVKILRVLKIMFFLYIFLLVFFVFFVIIEFSDLLFCEIVNVFVGFLDYDF